MSTPAAIALLAAAIALVAVFIARGSGPRVTTIETREDDPADDDEDKRA